MKGSRKRKDRPFSAWKGIKRWRKDGGERKGVKKELNPTVYIYQPHNGSVNIMYYKYALIKNSLEDSFTETMLRIVLSC